MKLIPALSGRGARVLAATGQKLIQVGHWSSSAVYGNPTRARHRQRVVALQATHACTSSTVSYMLRTLWEEKKDKEKRERKVYAF